MSCNFIFFFFWKHVTFPKVPKCDIRFSRNIWNYTSFQFNTVKTVQTKPHEHDGTWRRNESFTINWTSIYVIIMAKKLKQGSLTIPPISTKRTTTCHLKSLNIKLTTVLEIQAEKCFRVKLVGILTSRSATTYINQTI